MAEASDVETAPAKLNLDLLVIGRRADGYHELDSMVVFAPIADRLFFEEATTLSLTLTGPFAAALDAGPDNLVLRAAQALEEALDRPIGCAITLEKNLPVASGIGGGSADAAATLRGLARRFGLDWSAERLHDLGSSLGADVPVCIYARPVRLRGIGERLDPIRGLPVLPLLLVNPGVPVPTGSVFARLALEGGLPGRPPLRPAASLVTFATWLAQSRNDLQAAAIAVAPVIGEVIDEVAAEPGCLLARMSGSGATVFGLFADEARASAAAAGLARRHPGWWCRHCVVQATAP